MANEKKYTAQEAAVAVLKKAEEVFSKSALMKGQGLAHTPGATGKHGTAKIGERGVHQPPTKEAVSMGMRNNPGQSAAGFHARMSTKQKERGGPHSAEFAANARELHGQKLAELRDMPKPNLTKEDATVENEIGTKFEKAEPVGRKAFSGQDKINHHAWEAGKHRAARNFHEKSGNHKQSELHRDLVDKHLSASLAAGAHHGAAKNHTLSVFADSLKHHSGKKAPKIKAEFKDFKKSEEDIFKSEKMAEGISGLHKVEYYKVDFIEDMAKARVDEKIKQSVLGAGGSEHTAQKAIKESRHRRKIEGTGTASLAGVHRQEGDYKPNKDISDEDNRSYDQHIHKQHMKGYKESTKPNLTKEDPTVENEIGTKVQKAEVEGAASVSSSIRGGHEIEFNNNYAAEQHAKKHGLKYNPKHDRTSEGQFIVHDPTSKSVNMKKSEDFSELYEDLMKIEDMSKAEQSEAPHGDYGNTKPHVDHVSMASKEPTFHMKQQQAHDRHAGLAAAKGDKDLAAKHSKMATMHGHYFSGLTGMHHKMNDAGALHSELSGHNKRKEDKVEKAEEVSSDLAKANEARSKGVHKQVHLQFGRRGQSPAGVQTREMKSKPGAPNYKDIQEQVKGRHKEVLSDLKAMPKPNLTKDEASGGNKEAPSDSLKPEIAPNQPQVGESEKPGKRIESQKPPAQNPKEEKEGNNQEWGTQPATYGTLKLAHFMGYMKAKKSAKNKIVAPGAQTVMGETQSKPKLPK